MDIVVGLQVTGQWVKSDGITFVSSSCNIYSCSFDFSEDWQEYTKTAVFRLNDGTPIETPISNNTCKIPWEALDSPGVLRIGVYGLSGQQPDLKRYPTVWSREIRVVEGVPDGDDEQPPSPSVYEQFVEDVKDSADKARLAAEEAKEAAEKFKQYDVGHGLKLEDDGQTLAVDAVNDFDGDNTLPITAAAVQASIGNIEIVLSKI